MEIHGDLSPTPGCGGLSFSGLGPVSLPGSPKKTAETVLVVWSDSPDLTLLLPPVPAASLLLSPNPTFVPIASQDAHN